MWNIVTVVFILRPSVTFKRKKKMKWPLDGPSSIIISFVVRLFVNFFFFFPHSRRPIGFFFLLPLFTIHWLSDKPINAMSNTPFFFCWPLKGGITLSTHFVCVCVVKGDVKGWGVDSHLQKKKGLDLYIGGLVWPHKKKKKKREREREKK